LAHRETVERLYDGRVARMPITRDDIGAEQAPLRTSDSRTVAPLRLASE
jgi:hypothetical protein